MYGIVNLYLQPFITFILTSFVHFKHPYCTLLKVSNLILNYEQIRFFVVATTYQVNKKRIIFFLASCGVGETENYVPSMRRETIRNKGFEKYGNNNTVSK
jgi:hypothetical protein